ncbi:MAG: hypothetical protein GXO47_09030 [Chlorobi bacterium]|nr:hypothetical protein [Chlorobiota bacterium]
MDIPDNSNKDDRLKELLGSSRLEMPFPDFEDKVMDRIKEEVREGKAIDKNLRLSWIFFALGTAFGLLLSVILSPSSIVFGFPVSKLAIPAYITGGTLFLLFLEQLFKFTFERKKHHN